MVTTKGNNMTITQPQANFINKLVNERYKELGAESVDDGIVKVAELYGCSSLYELTKQQASAIISTILATKPEPPADLPPALAEAKRYFDPNRYGSYRGTGCLTCGEPVAAGEGYAITGVADQQSGWGLLHKGDCANTTSQQRAERHAKAQQEEQDKKQAERNKVTELYDLLSKLSHRVTRKSFRVAIFSTTTDNDLDFLGVYYERGGKRNRIERHIGSTGHRPRRVRLSIDQQLDFAKRLMAFDDDRLARAQEAYGRHLHYCGRCGAALTDHESRQLGLGPDCAKLVNRHTV